MVPATALPAIGIALGLFSTLGGLLGASESPQDEAARYALDKIREYLPYFQQTPFSKGEVFSLANTYKRGVDTSVSIAKNKVATTLAESLGAVGVPAGQPRSSMYVSEIAPLESKALESKTNIDMWAAEFWKNIDADTKNRVINALGLLTGATSSMPDMTSGQRFFTSFLNALNLSATGLGNLVSGFNKASWEPQK